MQQPSSNDAHPRGRSSFAAFAVNNPVAMNLIMFLIIAFGLYEVSTLNRDFFPEMQPERIAITTLFPGASPEEIEKGITAKVEEAIDGLDGIDELEARVLEGRSTVSVVLEDDANVDRLINDIKQAVDAIVDLPEQAEESDVTEVEFFIPVINLVVFGDVPERRLRREAQEIRDRLLASDEISKVLMSGARNPEISIEVHPGALDRYQLSFEQVAQAVGSLNLQLAAGQLKTALGNTRVRTVGETPLARELESVPVAAGADGGVVTLAQIGRVIDGFEDQVNRGSFQGKRAISLYVMKNRGEDAIRISEFVQQFVATQQRQLEGTGLSLDTNTNLARFIEGRLALLTENAAYGLVLVFVALAAFLRLAVAFWAAAGLVVSFLGTFIAMDLMGISINLISLFGLIVVLGLIVDDAIVIGESIYRRMEEGMAPSVAAVVGTQDVALPVLAAVLTSIASFLPLAFVDGMMGDYMSVLPMVVIAALSMSLLEAFFILPSHMADYVRIKSTSAEDHSSVAESNSRREGGKLQRWREERLMSPLVEGYTTLLRKALRWRYVTVACFVGLLIVVFSLVPAGILPWVLLQSVDADTLVCEIEMAAGTRGDETEKVIAQIERAASEIPGVLKAFSMIGMQIDDQGQPVFGDPETLGQITVELDEPETRPSSDEIIARWRQAVGWIPGASRVSFRGIDGGPGGFDIEIELRGGNIDQLQMAVQSVREELGRYRGVASIEDNLELGKPEVQLQLLPSARGLGLTAQSLAVQLRGAFFGLEAQRLQRGRDEVRVYVRLPEDSRRSLADLEALRISTPTGGRVPLREVASLTMGRGYASITRVDRVRTVEVKADVDENIANTAEISDALELQFHGLEQRFPGVTLRFEGRKKETADSMQSLQLGFIVAMAAVYSIIAMLFRSYIQPFIVMSVIPFATVGAFLGHLLLGFPLTLLSMIGIVALVGVVVNDSLILVNGVNSLRQRMPLRQAVVEGGRLRLRPILLTSITTVLGLSPLMLETSFQAQFLIPLAISIVFGLAFATLIVLVLIPSLYYILEDFRELAGWGTTVNAAIDEEVEP